MCTACAVQLQQALLAPGECTSSPTEDTVRAYVSQRKLGTPGPKHSMP